MIAVDFDKVVHLEERDRNWLHGTPFGAVASGFLDWASAQDSVAVYSSAPHDVEFLTARMRAWLDHKVAVWAVPEVPAIVNVPPSGFPDEAGADAKAEWLAARARVAHEWANAAEKKRPTFVYLDCKPDGDVIDDPENAPWLTA